jgi:hypothetical protein
MQSQGWALFAVRAVVANRSLAYGSAQIVQVESDNDAA